MQKWSVRSHHLLLQKKGELCAMVYFTNGRLFEGSQMDLASMGDLSTTIERIEAPIEQKTIKQNKFLLLNICTIVTRSLLDNAQQ